MNGSVFGEGYIQTNKIKSSISISSLKYTPVYFQSYIEKEYEVRVTFVDGAFFPVRIDSLNPVDWRKPGNEVNYSICDIPDDVRDSCLAFMAGVGAIFGCFDFVVKDDIWYFLEMNSNGQWAWLEFELDLEISRKIVEYLDYV